LSFPLLPGLEVESLSGESLHHWSELTEDGRRQVVLYLNSKTIGAQKFSLTLAGSTPMEQADWGVPRFELNEAKRHTGELVVQPATGIRLRTVSRQNVSETDPRSLGGQTQGVLAFRLLQRDWSLTLGIDRLEAWVTGQVKHEVALREGQTRSTLMADFQIQNAAIRQLTVKLPIVSADEIKTVRISGEVVSDFARSAKDTRLWIIHTNRHVIGSIPFQIEYEWRGERPGDGESLGPIEFPEARPLASYYAVRAGGRLEIELGTLSQGWQRIDWSSVPQALRDAGNRSSPAVALRALAPTTPLGLRVVRHSLAEALKLRVASGTLTSILSPTGDQLTAVDLTMEVFQRSSLSVQLPADSQLFSIFVNGQSVHSIRQSTGNAWQFYILPGLDDRTAQVRFVYSLTSGSLSSLNLLSPQLNVPLENIQWNVIAPSGFRLIDSDGNLELVEPDSRGGTVATENEQLKQTASVNPILQQEQLNYRPHEISQLLADNTQQDNAILQQIAGRLVQHQRSTEPAPQAIQISLPEEGSVDTFRRTVQVAESAPLELKLQFCSKYELRIWQWLLLAGLLVLLTATLSYGTKRSNGVQA